jgi:hypothetical protein
VQRCRAAGSGRPELVAGPHGADGFDQLRLRYGVLRLGLLLQMLGVTGTIGTNPLAQFADWKLASDETGLKGKAYLLQKELIRKDAFPYQFVGYCGCTNACSHNAQYVTVRISQNMDHGRRVRQRAPFIGLTSPSSRYPDCHSGFQRARAALRIEA